MFTSSNSINHVPDLNRSRDNIEFSSDRNARNGPYFIASEAGSAQQVYCHMDDIPGCEGGGWTLAMKIDGTKVTNARLC